MCVCAPASVCVLCMPTTTQAQCRPLPCICVPWDPVRACVDVCVCVCVCVTQGAKSLDEDGDIEDDWEDMSEAPVLSVETDKSFPIVAMSTDGRCVAAAWLPLWHLHTHTHARTHARMRPKVSRPHDYGQARPSGLRGTHKACVSICVSMCVCVCVCVYTGTSYTRSSGCVSSYTLL